MFQAGFARLDVTPPLGIKLSGYSKIRYADHILDPLELNCVAFSDGENKAVLIAADLLSIAESDVTPIRGMIAKRCGIPADHVYMQCLHQHTSVRFGLRAHFNQPKYDENYRDVLYRKYCDVASLAIRDLKDATLSQAEGETAEPISFIRRYLMKDGSYRTNPGRGKGYLVERPLDDADNTVRLLRFHREEGEDIALINFSTHPDVIGGIDPTGISADWPGFARRYTEAALEGVKCIVLNGAQGDANHINPFREKEEEQKRRGVPHSSFMGKTISDVAVSLWDKTVPLKTGRVWGKVEMLYIPTNKNGIERTEECQRIRSEIAQGLREPFKTAAEKSSLNRIADLQRESIFQKLPVCVLCIGGAGFVGFGGEPFTRYAANVREVGKELYMITTCLTGGGQGYLPTKKAFEEGGYEAGASRFDPCLEEEAKACAASLLNEYKNL